MTIYNLTIDNFKSIKHLQIDFNGADATIYGQNGAGKTTIIDAVCWLISGKMSDGKAGESANLHDSNKITTVEITMNSGIKLRRECNGKSLYFVQGVPCNATDFKFQVAELFKNSVPALLTPFNFCRLHYSERRNILLNLFAKNISVDLADFEYIADELQKVSPEQIIKSNTYNKKQLEKELAQIPARIDEIQKNIVEVDTEKINSDIAELEKKISAKLEEVKICQAASSKKLENYNMALNLETQAQEIEEKISDLRSEYRNNEIELNRLRRDYSDVQKATSGTCPTCGNKIPASNIAQIKAREGEIISQGKEISISADISNCDKKIYLAESYIRRKIEVLESSINRHFQFVKFKMFEDFKTVEGVKDCCDPFLNGVPYAALSKGEQLKASLDILNTLQKAFGVKLPVFIDDAENYTSNSFLDIPNQIILLKAVEGVRELKFDIDEKNFEGSLSA